MIQKSSEALPGDPEVKAIFFGGDGIGNSERKKVHMNFGLILNVYRDRAVWIYKSKALWRIIKKEKLLLYFIFN